ncbi:24388_t:CDS:1, partial [Cetraspora pellucida]
MLPILRHISICISFTIAVLLTNDNIFNIEEDIYIDISNNKIDNILKFMLDATDGVGQEWNVIDNNLEVLKTEKVKTNHFQ